MEQPNCDQLGHALYPISTAGSLATSLKIENTLLNLPEFLSQFLPHFQNEIVRRATCNRPKLLRIKTMDGMMNRQIFVAMLVLVVYSQTAFGQGKLNRVRQNIKPAAAQPPAPRQDQDEHTGDNNQRHNHHSRSRPPRRSSRNCSDWGVFSFISTPPPVVQHVHVHETVISPAPSIPPTSSTYHVPSQEPNPPLQLTPPRVEQELITEPVISTPDRLPTHLPAETFVEPVAVDFQANWVSRFSVQGASDFDGLFQGGFDWLLQDPGGLGLQTSATMFRESGTDLRDHLWIGDVNLVYEPVTGDLRTRFGVGFNWLGDRFGGDIGLNLTGGLDFQLTKDFCLVGEVDFGTLGDSDFLNSQISLGYQVDQKTEFYSGYRFLDIGGAKLDGIVFGARFRF